MSGLYWSPDTICFDPKDEARRCELIRLGGNVDHHFRPARPRWLSDNLRRILDNQDAGWGERTLATMLQAHEQYGEPTPLHFWHRQVAPLSDR